MNGFEYDIHPSVEMVRKWLSELPSKTGRSLGQWTALVRKQGPMSLAERRAWLKLEYDLPKFTIDWIAERVDGNGGEMDSPESYARIAPIWVDTMFSGKKAHLRPIYDQILRAVKQLDPNVRVCPCRTIVPFYRNRVFAQVKPSTNTRIDLGLALGDTAAEGRLIDTGGLAKKDRITHRIALTSVDDIDREVHRLLRTSYEGDA